MRVDFTVAVRGEVCRIVEEIRVQMLTGKLPGAVDDERCRSCQLIHHCLPELTKASRRVRRYLNDVVFGCAT